MAGFRVIINKLAEKHIKEHYHSGNKASIKKIKEIIADLQEHPYTGVGNPEPLKYELAGFWSRRINQKDRMIYIVEDEIVTVTVISAIGHYNDK